MWDCRLKRCLCGSTEVEIKKIVVIPGQKDCLYEVRCVKCGRRTDPKLHKQQAINSWNCLFRW